MSGQNYYHIKYETRVVTHDLKNLSQAVLKRIKLAIEIKLCIDPVSFGKPLRYSLKKHFRLRVGDYRIIYRVEIADRTVWIVHISHRKDVYEN